MPAYAGTARSYGFAGRSALPRTHATQERYRLHAAAIDRSFVCKHWARPLKAPAEHASKLLFDMSAALLLLVGLSPALLTLAFLVWRSGGSPIFGSRRIGAKGEAFTCWKFRTMVPDAEARLAQLLATDPEARAEWNRGFKLKQDPRITPIGRILRTTSLDEIPQLINVLKGEMSLVGPRPILPDEAPRYGAVFHDYVRCRPGITGPWQVNGRNDADYNSRMRLTRDYARNWRFITDCRILLRTAVIVFRRSGAY